MNELIKDWYTKEYPSDDLGREMNGNATFSDLFETLDNYLDVFDLIGVSDTVIRERVFDKLADIMGVDYDYVYKQWIRG